MQIATNAVLWFRTFMDEENKPKEAVYGRKVLKVEGLSKTYGKTVAVDNISFQVFEVEILGMVGPNGAG
jgi:ATPase subunit of ABC transporter with duplicated ATPase domains